MPLDVWDYIADKGRYGDFQLRGTSNKIGVDVAGL